MSGIASEEVFELIKALSMSEKRYFKAYAGMGNEKQDTIYVRLFDAIDSQKKYDEKKILKKISLSNPQQLSNQKKYLSELIIESLRLYHAAKSVDAQLESLLIEIEILYRKRLFKLCIKKIRKAKELANKYEKNYHLLMIFNWEDKTIAEIISKEKMETEVDKFLIENIAVAKRVGSLAEFRSLRNEIAKPFRIGGLSRWRKNMPQLKKIIEHPLMKTEPTSFHERFYYYNILISYHIILSEWDKTNALSKKLLEILEANPHQIADWPRQYTSIINNFIISSVFIRKEKELKNVFLKIRQMMKDPLYLNDYNNMFGLFFCCNSMLDYFVHSGNFQKGILFYEESNDFFEKLLSTLSKGFRFSVCLNFAQLYFGAGNYKQSLFWLRKILNEESHQGQDDFHMSARLLSFIVNYELDQEKDLEYFAKSTHRFLLSKKRESKIEAVIIEFIRKKISKGSKKELQEAFIELKVKIEKLAVDPLERTALNFVDFVSWLESKIQKKPFADILREKWKMSGAKMEL